MAESQFVVDLGNLKLSDEQSNRINVAIQKAVAGELASINSKSQLAFIPVNGVTGIGDFKFKYGFIIREFPVNKFKDIFR